MKHELVCEEAERRNGVLRMGEGTKTDQGRE